jgi:hypothetical protein
MSYTILPYTKAKAKAMGLTVKPSTRSGKKLDVFRDGEYIDSIGQLGAMDYPYYIKEKGKAYADERRRLYHARHIGNSQGERLAKGLLW